MVSDSATRDLLTGVYTRDAFEPALRDAVACAQDASQPLTLLILDLDYFKSVNDAFGHARGDRVLAEVARRMLVHVRASDRIFRYGGDEFVVLAPGATREQSLALAHRLLNAIAGDPFPGERLALRCPRAHVAQRDLRTRPALPRPRPASLNHQDAKRAKREPNQLDRIDGINRIGTM